MKCFAYVRVSTDTQSVENQIFEIEQFAKKNNITVDEWKKDDGISGTVDYSKRGIGRIIEEAQPGDVIIISELSRLGRRLLMIMECLNRIMLKGCTVYSIKEGFRLGDDIQCKVLAFAFGLSAEIERNLISQRTKEALARKRSEGVILGRPVGARSSVLKLDASREKVIRMLEAGYSKLAIAEACGTHRNTLQRYLKRIGKI